MGIKTQNGFTIIETMLFLAVTGMLAAAILVGSGLAIGQQRYRDSVNSVKSYVQQQYSEVTNVINSRDKAWTCDANGNVVQTPTNGEARGTSNCVLLGRLITVDDTGTKLTASNVIGYKAPGAATAATDIDELTTNYKLTASPIDQDITDVSWGAQLVKPQSTTPMPLSMLIIRSPISGATMTFTTEGAQTNIANIILASHSMDEPRDLCVNADAGSFVGKRLEVRIDAYATNQGAVQIPTESTSVCD